MHLGTYNGERVRVFRSSGSVTRMRRCVHGHNCMAHLGSPLALALVAAGASDRILGRPGMMP